MSFKDFSFHPEILRALDDIGFSEPTSVQSQTFEPSLKGRDILGIAQTGTGKTGAFLLPILTLLAAGRARARMPRCVILEPTRELAQQVEEECKKFSKHLSVNTALLIGGMSSKAQEKKIEQGADILIATPGRFLDHFERGKLLLNDIQHLVIDEADRMLDMGFIPDVEKICSLTPFTRQTMLFSATMPPAVGAIAENFMSAPFRVEVERQSSVNKNVTQYVLAVTERKKRDLLRGILQKENPESAIIFSNSKRGATILTDALQKYGFSVAALHGDIPQHLRMKVLDAFRSKNLSVLVASDVAARGIDIPHVSCVINFDIPSHCEDYVHRIGRTGRGGNTGTAYTLTAENSEKDERYLEAIEALIQSEITKLDPADFIASKPKRERASKSVARTERGEGVPQKSGRGARSKTGLPEKSGDTVSSLKNDPKRFSDLDEIPAFLLRPVSRSLSPS